MNAWEYVNGAGAVIPCAWCQQEQGVKPQAGESHGICQRHAKAMLATIGTRVARDAEGVASLRREAQPAEVLA
jgi:hypothetical protein